MFPDDFTLRELVIMAKQKALYDWHHTSAIMAMILNVNIVKGEWIRLDAFVPGLESKTSVSSEPSDIITDPAMKRCLKNVICGVINGCEH